MQVNTLMLRTISMCHMLRPSEAYVRECLKTNTLEGSTMFVQRTYRAKDQESQDIVEFLVTHNLTYGRIHSEGYLCESEIVVANQIIGDKTYPVFVVRHGEAPESEPKRMKSSYHVFEEIKDVEDHIINDDALYSDTLMEGIRIYKQKHAV